MKKILFLAISLLVAGSVSAQHYYQPRHRHINNNNNYDSNNSDFYQPSIGFTAGLNIANTIGSYNSGYSTSTRAGLNAGIIFNLPIFYPLSFAPEVLYSQKGYSASTQDGNFNQRTDYIDIPLLAKFRAGPMFNIFVGPQLSYLISTTNTYENGFKSVSEQYYNNNNGNKSYVGGVIGVSFDINRYVDLRARYTIDLDQTDYRGDTYIPNYRNQVWQFGVGFKFN
jgi:hypothetical protein